MSNLLSKWVSVPKTSRKKFKQIEQSTHSSTHTEKIVEQYIKLRALFGQPMNISDLQELARIIFRQSMKITWKQRKIQRLWMIWKEKLLNLRVIHGMKNFTNGMKAIWWKWLKNNEWSFCRIQFRLYARFDLLMSVG